MRELFYELDRLLETEVVPGFHARFVHAETMTLVYWQIQAGSKLPEHQHPHEQVCNVLEGEFELTIDGQTRCLSAGSVGVIPSQAIHSGTALTDCRVLDVFHPVREDYRMKES